MNNIEAADLFADLWRRSRSDAGKSQKHMAKALGVSLKTVQNWECGLSCPSQRQGFLWFQALGLQPLPYYLSIIYPEFYTLTPGSPDEAIDAALIALIMDMPIEVKRKLLFVAAGGHGSSPLAILELIVAHLHTPLKDRLNIASSVLNNYEVAEASGSVVAEDHIRPDLDLLALAFSRGKEAAKNGRNEYTAI